MTESKWAMVISLGVALALNTPLILAQGAMQSDREVMYHRYLEFASYMEGGSIQPHWMLDGSSFWYAEGVPDNTIIYKVNPKTNSRAPMFDMARLRGALTTLLGHQPAGQGLPFQSFKFDDAEKSVRFTVEDEDFILQFDPYSVSRISDHTDEENGEHVPRVVRKDRFGFDMLEIRSPDDQWFAHLEGHNLWLRSIAEKRLVPITTDGTADYEWGEAYEWDANYGRPWSWWSPDGSKLAIKRVDSRQMHKIPVLEYTKGPEEIEWVLFPRIGGPSWQRDLHIFDIPTNRRIAVDLGEEPELTISVFGWRPDGSELIFMVMNREHKRLDLMAADANSGKVRVIFTETRDTFFQPLWAWPPRFISLGDGEQFIWTSDRDGWNHIYLRSHQKLIRQLTEGPFQVHDIKAIDEELGWVYFTAHGNRERPYDTHVYRVRLDGTGFAQLTDASGQHRVQFAPSREFFIDTHSNVDRPPAVELRRADGMLLETLSRANIDALTELSWTPPEEFVAKATDGKTDLHGVLYKPFDFDPHRKYPVIEYIYDGSYSTIVPRSFRSSYSGVRVQALAQLGFITVIVDGRGTAERGKNFQDVAYRNVGRFEIPDHAGVLQQLAEKRPYMDLGRVGIFGGSNGGYMALRALLSAPDVYHVGVAASPGVDLRDLQADGIEPYLGLLEENSKAYEYASNLHLADKLEGKLLLIHGTSDRGVPVSQTLKMVEALIAAEKSYDLLLMPGEDHQYTRAGSKYAADATRRYFQEHLKPEKVVVVSK